jgi:hypothetical protein
MRPVFFKLTLWNDPQEWDVCPIFRDACRAANREPKDERVTPDTRAARAYTSHSQSVTSTGNVRVLTKYRPGRLAPPPAGPQRGGEGVGRLYFTQSCRNEGKPNPGGWRNF